MSRFNREVLTQSLEHAETRTISRRFRACLTWKCHLWRDRERGFLDSSRLPMGLEIRVGNTTLHQQGNFNLAHLPRVLSSGSLVEFKNSLRSIYIDGRTLTHKLHGFGVQYIGDLNGLIFWPSSTNQHKSLGLAQRTQKVLDSHLSWGYTHKKSTQAFLMNSSTPIVLW